MRVFLFLLTVTSLLLSASECTVANPVSGDGFKVTPGQRQLFLDDAGIAEIHNLARTMHPPEKKGAVIKPDRPWEFSLQTRSVPAWDEEKGVFKIWMITSVGDRATGTPDPTFGGMTYAESKDGIHWTKPVLRQLEYKGSKENSFLSLPTGIMENAVRDPDDPDPGRRYKGLLGAIGRFPAISPDGIQWQKLQVPEIPSLDESNMSYDRQTRTFIATVKQGGPYGRSHAISTSRDFKTWTKPQLVFHADELDQQLGAERIRARFADPTLAKPVSNNPAFYNVDVYNLGVFRYEGLYLGLAAMFHSTGPDATGANTDGFHLIQLLASHDLYHWKRMGNREPFIGPSKIGQGAYDLTQLLPPSAPVARGDELWFYYTGIKYRERPAKADPDAAAICLAVLRRDGFVSLDAGKEAGSVITRPLRMPGKRLFVNVDAPDGELRAAIADASGKSIGGFGTAECIPLTGNHVRAELKWQGNDDLWALTGQDVTIRFQLRSGRLYSYWFEDEVTPPPFGIVRDDFEGSPVGAKVRLAETYVEGKGDSIAVTDEVAAKGKRSLKVVDAPGLDAVFNPHFYYTPNALEGKARCRFDIRLQEGAHMYHAWRDSGGSGPMLMIKDQTLEVAGLRPMKLPTGKWIHFDVVADLGPKSGGNWELTVQLPGQKPQHFTNIKPNQESWKKSVTWLGFVSQATDKKVFYLDNLEFAPAASAKKPVGSGSLGQELKKSLAGYWRFDDANGTAVADGSGNGNTATIHGKPTWVKDTGHEAIGGALAFNGIDTYVDCGRAESLNLHGKNFTLMAWIYIEQPGGILSKELGGQNWPEYGLGVLNDLTVQSSFWTANKPEAGRTVNSPALLVACWHHLAATYDGAQYILYIDGAEKNRSQNVSGSPYGADNRLFIGALPSTGTPGFGAPFKGRIAEVAVFTRGLSQEEVEVCCTQGIPALATARPAPERNKIIVVNGIDYRSYRLREALAADEPANVTFRNMVIETDGVNPKIVSALENPLTATELKNAKMLILANAPGPCLGAAVHQQLRQNVENGLHVLILGGLFSLGKGQYEGTAMSEIAPVMTDNKWSVKKLTPPLVLKPAEGVVFSKETNWGQNPSVLYYHADKMKDNTEVWLKAGDTPVLVVRKIGKGRVAAFLSAPIGTAPKGVLPYWKWDHWPRLLGEIVAKMVAQQ